VLTLKVGCGFSVDEIASSFLAKPATIAQRLVRAKRRLRETGMDVPEPTADLLRRRGPALREVVYLLFSGGHAAMEGDALVRSELCAEALRLARLMLGHPGGEHPATRALTALMCFHAARLPARTGPDGALVPLEAQDRTLWDRPLLAEGFHHLEWAAEGDDMTRYHLEAGIAAVHAAAQRPEDTDWSRVLELYDRLAALHPSGVVALNRAVAVGRVHGPEAGLSAAREAGEDPALARYHLRPAVEGAFLEELGRTDAAATAFREAAALAPSAPERHYLEARAAHMLSGT
jgi:RNA polymerase sigma-70 factor (ECF subfamily)